MGSDLRSPLARRIGAFNGAGRLQVRTVRDLLDEDVAAPGDVAAAFANEIDQIGEPICIVVDDLHLANKPRRRSA